MPTPPAAGPVWGLTTAAELFTSPLPEVMDRLSTLIAGVLHAAAADEPSRPSPPMVAVLTGDCIHAPVKFSSQAAAQRITSLELSRLNDTLAPGQRWVGPLVLGGEERRVLAVRSVPPGAAGSVFAVTLDHGDPPAEVVDVIAGLCDAAAVTWIDRSVLAQPTTVAANLAAVQERTRTVSELVEAHEATLVSLLTTLRGRDVADPTARAAAIELAATALVDLRERRVRSRDVVEEDIAAAFEQLREQLAPLVRYSPVRFELVAPAGRRGTRIPSAIAHAARAVSRGVAMALSDAAGVERVRVAWNVERTRLVVTARDDGPGTVEPAAIATSPAGERLDALGGDLRIDAVAGWGTTVVATIPLAVDDDAADSPLGVLNARELEVLELLAKGLRNAQIAATLTITAHTAKFHVANILRKLSVASRGEAAALAHRYGLSAA